VLIIDTHHHVDSCRVFDLDQPEELVLETMDANDVAATIVQPFPGPPDPIAVHDHIADMAKRHPGRIFGMVSLSPHRDRDDYHEEARRCVEDLGFVALKMHTIGHAVNPLGVDGQTIFETARDLDVPVMIHTGPGVPFADPAMLLPPAKRFPDVTIVMAHAGFGVFGGPAIAVAMECPNIVLETSWAATYEIPWALEELGAERVMFGADLAVNVATELTKYRSLDLDGRTLDAVLGGTAREVFQLDL
jgi:uncharacterized protein